MSDYRINIDQVTNNETLFHAGWLFADLKGQEVILETQNSNMSPLRLRATFAILAEGILNSGTTMSPDQKTEIVYADYDIPDLRTLARELTILTKVKFSIKILT